MLLLLVVISLLPAYSLVQAESADQWWLDDDVFYRVIYADYSPLSWYKARARCAEEVAGGELATVKTDRLNQQVLEQGKRLGGGRLWLGASDASHEGTWSFDDSSTLTYTPWGPNQPDNAAGNQNCLAISLSDFNYAGPGQWDDANCNKLLEGFVCQVAALNSAKKVWWLDNNVFYRVVYTGSSPLTRESARARCAEEVSGGELAAVKTERVNQRILEEGQRLGEDRLWLGASDVFHEGTWSFADGSTLTYTPWGPGQPDNARGNQNCLTVSLSDFTYAGPGQWDDEKCSAPLQGFVCQVSATDVVSK